VSAVEIVRFDLAVENLLTGERVAVVVGGVYPIFLISKPSST
jgi:hypothetical protein